MDDRVAIVSIRAGVDRAGCPIDVGYSGPRPVMVRCRDAGRLTVERIVFELAGERVPSLAASRSSSLAASRGLVITNSAARSALERCYFRAAQVGFTAPAALTWYLTYYRPTKS